MKPLEMSRFERFKGLIAAPFTPMKADGSLRLDAVRPYADYLADQGIVGAFICGTTGEGFSMTVSERKAVAEAWVEAAAGRLKVIVHVGHNCQADAAELAAHAQQCGADAVASIAPNFYKPCCVEDLVDFFAPVAAAAPALPFYYYNMPSMSGVSLPVDRFLELGATRIPTLQGIKFTHNNLMEMNQCIALGGGAFEILHGYDEILLCGLALGAKAAVGNPDAILPWYVNMHLPTGLLGLVIAGIFAAAMSTLSASMNSAATAFVTDIYAKIRPGGNTLRTAKRATLVIGAIGVAFALLMATWDVKSLWDEFSKILGILLGGLGGLFLLGFVSRRANAAGAVCGLAGCIAVQLTVMHFQAVNLLLYSTVGFLACFVIGWLASLLTGGNRKDIRGQRP